jgi:hypothetical protein
MTALAFAAELAAAGIRLEVDGDRLVARGRRLPTDLAARLRQHKPELVALLTTSQRPQYPHNPVSDGSDGNIAGFADDCRETGSDAAAGDLLARLALAGLDETAGSMAIEAVGDAAVIVTRALAAGGPGWVCVWSRVLGEELVWVRDEGRGVPAEYAALPRFDRAELAVLVAQRASADRLRAIVDVKRAVPGTRVVVDDGQPLTPAGPRQHGERRQ